MSQMFKLEDGGVVMLDAVQAVYDRSAIGYASRWEIYLKYCERPHSISSDDAERLIEALGEYVERPTIREGDELRNMKTNTESRKVPNPPPAIKIGPRVRIEGRDEGRCPHCNKSLDGTRPQ